MNVVQLFLLIVVCVGEAVWWSLTPPASRQFKFSLRRLVGSTTLFAVAFGAGKAMIPARDRFGFWVELMIGVIFFASLFAAIGSLFHRQTKAGAIIGAALAIAIGYVNYFLFGWMR